jgi:hypothetical protein
MLALWEPEAMLRVYDPAKHGFAGRRREHGSRTPKVHLIRQPEYPLGNNVELNLARSTFDRVAPRAQPVAR